MQIIGCIILLLTAIKVLILFSLPVALSMGAKHKDAEKRRAFSLPLPFFEIPGLLIGVFATFHGTDLFLSVLIGGICTILFSYANLVVFVVWKNWQHEKGRIP